MTRVRLMYSMILILGGIGQTWGMLPKLPPIVTLFKDKIISGVDMMISNIVLPENIGQEAGSLLTTNFVSGEFDNIRNMLDSYYVSYYFRQNIYALVFSESHPLGQIQHFIMTKQLDIFNFIIFGSAIGFFIKDIYSKKSVDKLLQKGIISKKTIRNLEIFILVVTTVMTKDVENATGIFL